jgi:hypothetical protein
MEIVVKLYYLGNKDKEKKSVNVQYGHQHRWPDYVFNPLRMLSLWTRCAQQFGLLPSTALRVPWKASVFLERLRRRMSLGKVPRLGIGRTGKKHWV